MDSLVICGNELFIQQHIYTGKIENDLAACKVFLKYQNSFLNKTKNVLNQNIKCLNEDFLVLN
jgi:hypothetical protein